MRRAAVLWAALAGLLLLAGGALGQKKVSVSEVSFDSSVEDVQWAGTDHKTVVLKTSKGRLYRSQDGGRTWGEITEHLRKFMIDQGGMQTEMLVESVQVNANDKNVILVVGSKHNHFISTDAAKTFRRIKQAATIHSWQFHPTKSTWALLSTWTESCNNPGKVGGDPCNHMLYVTKDLGSTFSLVASYVVQFSWGDVKHQQESRIYFTHHRSKAGEQVRYGGWTPNVDFAYTDDYGHTIVNVVFRGNKFLVSNGYIFVAKLADQTKQTVQLMVSNDGGKTFEPAQLPVEIQQKSYTILDTSENAVMLHVNHGDNSGTGNVYVSGPGGRRFSLSLPGNVRSASGECEFDSILSLEGAFIANFKDDPNNSAMSEKDLKAQRDAKNLEDEEEETTNTAVDKKHSSKKAKGRSEEVVRTVVSFDKGAVWSYLRAPRIDSTGQKIDCPPDRCWLHLHGVTNFHHYAPFYSVKSAVGLIMGTGNVGPSLRYEPDEINTYLSRDGGLTWVEAHKGAYIYEMGDHGGLIVMADDLRKTNQVVFSWNEGQSWYDFELGQFPVDVDNIVIEPNSASVEFLLYGTRGDTGVVFHMDFNALGQPQCKGVWSADSVSSDYETWTPTDGRSNDKCMLGREMTFTRRKQTSECFNGQNFDRPVVKKNCACQQQDFLCEFGFTRKVNSLECVPEDPSLTAPHCTSSSFFYMDAYRKVPGDTCEGGWVPPKVPVPCPQSAPFSRGAVSVLFVVFILIVAMGALQYASKSERFKKLFLQYGFESYQNVRYSAVGGKGTHETAMDHMYGHGDDEFDNDHDQEDAPTLLSYNASSKKKDDEELASPPKDLLGALGGDEETGDRQIARRAAMQTAAASVPKLAGPGGPGF